MTTSNTDAKKPAQGGRLEVNTSGVDPLKHKNSFRATRVEQLCKGDELLFELSGPNGVVWKLYLDGRFEGFPEGVIIQNHAVSLVHGLLGEVLRPIESASS